MYKKTPLDVFFYETLSKWELVSILSYLQINIAKIKVCKTNIIVNIVNLSENRFLELSIKSDSDLLNI